MRLPLSFVVAALVAAPATVHAQTPASASTATAVKSLYGGTTLEGMIPSGNNFDIAQLRLWYSDNVALVACYFKDKQHDQNFIENYIKVSDDSNTLSGFGR